MALKGNKQISLLFHKKKQKKLNQTRTTEWDQMLPPPPENQEPTAQPNISEDMSSILSPLDNSESQISQGIFQTQQPEELLLTGLIDELVIDEI